LGNKSEKVNRLNQVNVNEQAEEKFNLFYQSMFQNIKVAISWFDLKGKVFKINPCFVNMLGYQQDEVLGKPINSIITTVVKGEEKAFLSRILKGERITTTTDLLQKNGQVISVIMQSGPLLVDQDMVGGYLIFSDITPYQLSQARAKERESLLQTLIDKSRMGVVIIDQEHRVIETNKRFAEMLDYPLPEMYKLHTWDWEAIMNEAQIREVFKDLSKIDTTFETKHRRKDGSLYDVEVSATGTYVGDSRAVICICQDISDRKKTEHALQESEAKFRSFVENASDIIFTINEIGIIKYISPNVEKLCGYQKIELKNKSLFSFINPADQEGLKEFIEQNFRFKKLTKELEFRLRHKDNSWHWYALSASWSEDENHKPILLCIARNISERKLYEEQLVYLSRHDPLTGLYNRAFYDQELNRLKKERREYPISFLMGDMDGLKEVNDSFGHRQGDNLIRECASLIKKALRDSDTIIRIGGDEFLAILPKTDERGAAEIVERIKKNVADYNRRANSLPISISLGTATAHKASQSLEHIISKADKDMYQSKVDKKGKCLT